MSVHLEARPGEIAPIVLLPGDPLRAQFIADQFLDDAVCHNRVRNALGFTGHYQGVRVSVQSTGMGMPSAAIYVHELLAEYGAKVLVRIGTCGAIREDVKERDIILAQAASTDSAMFRGTFGGATYAAAASFDLLHRTHAIATAQGKRVRVGTVVTSDTFYADDTTAATWWQPWAAHGVLAAEMETAALYTLAARRDARALSILTVSDHVLTGVHTTSEERRAGFGDMAALALGLVAELRAVAIVIFIALLGSTARADEPVPPPDPTTTPTPPPPTTPPPTTPPTPPPATTPVAAPKPTAQSPIRVAILCEDPGRTKACPAFLLGLVDANPVLLNSPRAGADVLVYATANEVALVDQLHLRFVGQMRGAPSAIELDVDLDTRGTDDQQREALTPAFMRGIALFVAARHPSAVTVTLTTPPDTVVAKPDTSPWGLLIGINANASYTENYKSAESELVLVGRYITQRFRSLALASVAGGLQRQPPLMLEDGTVVSLDTERWSARTGAEAVYSFDDSWSVGFGSFTVFEDPNAQYKYNVRARGAIEWDMFRADDPRGNRLAVFYHLGWQVDRYNIRNEIGERFAHYPTHGIDAVGSVRHDKISYGLTLQSDVQVNHPFRRRQLTASPFVTVQLGSRVDLNLAFSITQRELPAPDPSAIDPSDYATLSRLQYAEPLSMNGSIGISIHWDPTNGVRNDRLESI